ncbi:hypothetical protein BX666DRAFT_1957061 [Dichotomocladium elegans]|nr:hypothetical protein BX666DRAFT_1957061 [Dichotomocladium elegans]
MLDPSTETSDPVFVCEQHYIARQTLICKTCHEPVEPGLEYHPHCLQCAECIANEQQNQDASCFEHQGRVYCRYHFSLLSDTWCAGCNMSILKQFVENHRYPEKRWHPECYMIQKFWNVRIAEFCLPNHENQHRMTADRLRESQNETEKKIKRIWTDLSAFQESSATCISDMLLHVAAGAYVEGLRMAGQFISHLEVLFSALDTMAMVKRDEIECIDISQSLCSQVVHFLDLLAQGAPVKSDTVVTQELLALVTTIAQNLKSLIHIGLTEALQLEHRHKVFGAVDCFLGKLLLLENKRVWMAGRYWFKNEPIPMVYDSEGDSLCQQCTKSIREDCIRSGTLLWHMSCFACTRCRRHLVKEIHRARIGQATNDHGVILLCNTCCSDRGESIQDTPFTYSTRLDQFLDLVKTTLGRLFMTANTTTDDETTVTHSSTMAMKDYGSKINTAARASRRRSSLLRLMNRSMRYQSATPLGAVHLTHVQRADKARLDKGQRPWPDTFRRSVTVREARSRTRLGSIRRALTTTHRKERRPLSGVFEQRKESSVTYQKTPPYIFETPDINTTPSITATVQSPRLMDLDKNQDKALRHTAAIYFETVLPNQFSLEQLISLIEPKRTSIWNKLKGHMRVAAHNKHDVHDGPGFRTFGIPLSVASSHRQGQEQSNIVLRDIPGGLAPCFSANALIPPFIQNCILALVRMDMSQEGVFRKNGNIRELNEICDAIDNDQASLDYLNESPIQLAALLKRYLRELPEPLLTFKLYDLFTMSAGIEDEAKAKTVLHLTYCMLPKPHRDTAQLLFTFLRWVATFHQTNKMDVKNLARVIAPTVFYSSSSKSDKLTAERQQSARDEIKVVEMLIDHQEEFCMIPAKLIPVLRDPKAADCLSDTKQALKYLEYFASSPSPPSTTAAASSSATRDGENTKYPFATFNRRSWLPGRQ